MTDQQHRTRYVIFTYDESGECYPADLEGEPVPRTMTEVGAALRTQAALGVSAVEVRRLPDNKDVTDKAITEMAYNYPRDMVQPDFLASSFHGQLIMREGQQ